MPTKPASINRAHKYTFFCLDDYSAWTSDFISARMIIISGLLLSTQELTLRILGYWICLYVRVKFEFKRLTPWRYTICIQCCIYENTGFPKKILTHSLMLFHANQNQLQWQEQKESNQASPLFGTHSYDFAIGGWRNLIYERGTIVAIMAWWGEDEEGGWFWADWAGPVGWYQQLSLVHK